MREHCPQCIIVALIAIFGGIFVSTNVYATNFPNQINSSTAGISFGITGSLPYTKYPDPYYYNLGNGFSGISSQVKFYLSSLSASAINFYLAYSTSSAYTNLCNVETLSIGSPVLGINTVNVTTTFNSGYYYTIRGTPAYTPPGCGWLYDPITTNGAGTSASFGGNNDFAIEYANASTSNFTPYMYWGESTTTYEISAPIPVRPATSTDNFGYWNVTSTFTTSTYNAHIEIRVAGSSSSEAFLSTIYHDKQWICGLYNTCNAEVSAQHVQDNPFMLNIGTWYAQATLLGKDPEQTLATSTITEFVIGSVGSPYFPPSTATTTLASSTIECSGNGFAIDSFCKVLAFLFVPSQNSLDIFSNLKTSVENKPPFGYFTSISTAISGLNEGTSTYALINASTTSAFSPIFSPIRTGINWILWLMFGFWLYKRMRHIEL